MIDNRALGEPPGLSTLGLETARAQTTRFYWVRACEHCLSRSTYTLAGAVHCSGCDRRAIFGQHEGEPPSSGEEGNPA